MSIRTSGTQDQNFIDEIIGNTILEQAIRWIVDNFSPEEIYEEKDLENWAENNGYVSEE